MNFLQLIQQVSANSNDETEFDKIEKKREIETQLNSLPSAILSSSILTKSMIQRQCRRKNYLSSIIINRPYNTKLTDEDIFSIFKNTNRPITDNQYLVTYLTNLHPFYDFIIEARGDKAIDIIKNISFMLKFYSESKDKIVFHNGERDERCFIILEGQVDIISPNEEYIKMTDEEYIHYLIQLREANETDMLKEVIDANNAIFPIDERPFDNWIRTAYRTIHSLKDKKQIKKGENQDIATIHKKKTASRRKSQPNVIFRIFETKKLKTLALNLEDDIITVYNQIETDSLNNTNYYQEAKTQTISSGDYIDRIKPIYSEKSSYILDIEKKLYLIKTYFISQSISKGDIFGEVLTDGIHAKAFENTKRSFTAITSQDTKCAFLNKEAFFDLLRLTLEKLRRDKINFLFDLRIFSKVNKALFIKHVSGCIKKKMINDQTIIFKENDRIGKDHFIYFIRSGQFEASCFKSIHDIDQIIKEKTSEVNNKQFENEYCKKQAFKLAIFGANDIIGLGDVIHQNKYLVTLKCVSISGVIFELHYEFFQTLMKADNTVMSRTEELQSLKKEIRNKLLKQQKDVRLKFLYNRIPKSIKETKPTIIEKMMLPIQSKAFLKSINNKNKYDIDNALRDEVSSTRADFRRKPTLCHRRITSRNNIRLKNNKKELRDRKGNHLDKADRMKIELMKQRNQIIKLDVSNSLTIGNTNTLYQTKNTMTIDNDSIVYSVTEGNNNDHQIHNYKLKNVVCKREASQINPLAYDDFERNYNTEYYFNVYSDTDRKKNHKYYLSLTDSAFPIKISTPRDTSLKKTSTLYKTISSFKTSSTSQKMTASNKKQHSKINLIVKH